MANLQSLFIYALKSSSFFSNINWDEIEKATGQTLTMLGFSVLFTVIIGFILGFILFLTSPHQILQQRFVYAILSFIVNLFRSVPFVILLLVVLPVTKALVGTVLGVKGSIPPLVIAAAPFFARLVESALREVDRGVIEAAQSMGASNWTIITRVLFRESRIGLIAAITMTAVTLVSYTAMSGIVGGGGLGDLAIRYGHYRYQLDVLIVSVILLVILVQLLQMAGDYLVKYFSRKRL